MTDTARLLHPACHCYCLQGYVVQMQAAKLGVVTGKHLAEHCRSGALGGEGAASPPLPQAAWTRPLPSYSRVGWT